jgi:hypothetical protein
MKNNTEDEKIIGMYTKYLEELFFKKVHGNPLSDINFGDTPPINILNT